MKTIKIGSILLFLFILQSSYSTNWLVGPSRFYTLPSQVSTLVANGDTVSIDAGIYNSDVAHWTANNLLLRGVGGMAHLKANGLSWGGKAIWVIGGNNTKVEWIEFSLCACPSENGAGIRQEGLNLTVSHCYFHDNENGILAGTLNPSKIIVEYTEFSNNGFGDGYTHNLYINNIDTLIFRYNYTHHCNIGHELKSRAHVNYVMYNRLSNEATGNASREIDLPNGGTSYVIGNVIEQGPNSTNSGIVGYGLEGLTNPGPQEFYFVNNTVVNDRSSGTFISLPASGLDLYKSYNNIFAGPGTSLSGAATVIDSSNNIRATSIVTMGFVSPSSYDYHLIPSSIAVNSGTNPGLANSGFPLTPDKEYSHPANEILRLISGTIDIGAHEFSIPIGINEVSDLKNEFHYWMHDGTVTCATSLHSVDIYIYDVTGKLLLTKKIGQGISVIDFNGFPAGVYILKGVVGSEVVSGKFVR
ncbi:MAG: T9SS type A sorting domain-containing protein [Bacteroidetes bacterium]|nr:T9SS type A sorting domain-containing protein [Bacteroidota bacterium]